MDLQRTVQNLNTLARFLGPRDLPEPTPEALKEHTGLDRIRRRRALRRQHSLRRG